MQNNRDFSSLPPLALSGVLVITWLGFVFHTSSGPSLLLGKYSLPYAVGLAGSTAVLLAAVIFLWGKRRATALNARPFLAVAGITIILMCLILPGVYIWLHQSALNRDVFSPLKPGAHSFFQIELAPYPTIPAASGRLRVLTLGGSTTYGSGLTREQAYPAALERILRKRHPNQSLEVLNAGVPWHTTMHSLLRYVSRYAEWKPDVVIVMHAFNDIFQASEGKLTTGKFSEDYGHFFGALGNRVRPADRFRDEIYRTLFYNWFSRVWFSDLRTPAIDPPRPRVDLLRALPAFRRNLANIVQRAQDDGAKVIVLSQPFLYRTDLGSDERARLFFSYYYADYAQVPSIEEQIMAMRAFNAASRDVALARNALFLDVEAMVPKTQGMFFDDVHYTELGARMVAEAVAASIPLEWLQIGLMGAKRSQ